MLRSSSTIRFLSNKHLSTIFNHSKIRCILPKRVSTASSNLHSSKVSIPTHRFSNLCGRHVSEFTSSKFYSTGKYPEYNSIALPALSPTMEFGTIVSWAKQEGDQINEGDLLAEIETDKATMGFEASEDGYLARILKPAGSKDVPLGTILCLTVSNEADVAAFKDFADVGPESTSSGPASTPASNTVEKPVASQKSYPDHSTVVLPSLSPTMEQGSLFAWLKQEGDSLAEGDVLAQIETDKATMDFETPEEGYLAKILIPAGTKDIPVGKALCVIVENKEDVPLFAEYVATTEDSAPSQPSTAPPPVAITAQASLPDTPSPPKPSSNVTTSSPSANQRIFVSPLARKLANEKGIDLKAVKGTGPDGRIIADDIQKFDPSKVMPQVVKDTKGTGHYDDLPLTNIRKVIASRLQLSKQTVPHYYLSIDVNMGQVIQLREQFNKLLEKESVKLSVNDFVIKASALSCMQVPQANSSWQDTFIRQHNQADICVAVATENGLITPIVTNAERKGLATINKNVKELAEKARNNQLKPHEFQGGTFTISNLGMFGVKNFSAIINPPQACILAVGSTHNVFNGTETLSMMSCTLSCDHRVVDGAVGAEWLSSFKKLLEQPQAMLL